METNQIDTQSAKLVAIAELNPIVTDIAAFEGTIEGIDVTDDETQGQLGDLVKMMLHRRNKLEDKRKSLVNPLNKVVREINALFKPPRERIDGIVSIAKKKMSRYAEAQLALEREAKRLAEEEARREREEAAELARQLAAKAGEAGEDIGREVEAQAEEKLEKAEKTEAKVAVTRGQAASVVVSKTWKAEVIDLVAIAKAVAEGRLPANVLEPNMRALNALARDRKEAAEVDGVRFYEHVSTGIR